MITRKNCVERLQVLILVQDPETVALVRATLENLGVTASYFSPDSTAASEVLASHHFDGIILDCADPEWSREMLKKIRTRRSNRQSRVSPFRCASVPPPAPARLAAEKACWGGGCGKLDRHKP